MMTSDQIINLLKGPKNQELAKAEQHEERLRLHGEETDAKPLDNPAYERFFNNYPASLLPKEKASTFGSLITWPLPTVSVVNEVFDELSKVFEGQNKVFEFYFKDEQLESDFQNYRKDIKEPSFWSTIGWELAKNNINSVIAVDLALEQGDGAPEPNFFVIPICDVHTILNDPNTGSCDLLIWTAEPTPEELEMKVLEVAYAYDEGFYRLLYRFEGKDLFELITEVPHELGYTPARMFWTDKSKQSDILKRAPHSKQLGDVDWILYQTICSRNLELYAGFPIVTTYQEQCDYQNADGFQCEDGFIFKHVGSANENGDFRKEKVVCPSCSNRTLVGPGSVKEVPAPIDNQSADLMPAVEVTKGDTDSLKWFAEDLDQKIREFSKSVTGKGGEPDNSQAKNEKQVQSDFENRQAVLANIAGNLEQIQKFTLDTLAILRYGNEQYQGSVVSYGTKFFLQSEMEVLEAYQSAKTQGLPNYILEQRRIAMLQKQFKNDPQMMQRVQILDQLEPLPDYSLTEITKASIADRETIAYKAHFNDLVKRFELEHDDIVKWRENIDMKVKVAAIDEILKTYLDDVMPEEEVPVDPLTGQPLTKTIPVEDTKKKPVVTN